MSNTTLTTSDLFVYSFYVIESVANLSCNILLILGILGSKQTRHRKELLIIAGLGFANLLHALGYLIGGLYRFGIYLNGSIGDHRTPWDCMLLPQTPLMFIGGQAESIMLVAVSLDRLFSVRWFAVYRTLPIRYAYTILCVVLVAGLSSILTAYILSATRMPSTPVFSAICIAYWAVPRQYGMYHSTIAFSGGALSVLIYVVVVVIHKRMMAQVSFVELQDSYLRRQRKLTRTVAIMIVFTFFLYVIPNFCVAIMTNLLAVAAFTTFAPYGPVIFHLSSLTNVFIIYYKHQSVRRSLRKYCYRFRCHRVCA